MHCFEYRLMKTLWIAASEKNAELDGVNAIVISCDADLEMNSHKEKWKNQIKCWLNITVKNNKTSSILIKCDYFWALCDIYADNSVVYCHLQPVFRPF